MGCIDRNITLLRLYIPGRIHHFTVRCTRRIFLHPQAIPCQNIAVDVMNTVGKELHIIRGINQCGIEQGAHSIHRQAASRTGKAIYGYVTQAVKYHVAACREATGCIEHNTLRAERAVTLTCSELAVVG